MRATRVFAIAAVLALTSLVVPAGPADATHSPAGAITCTVNSFGVKDPTHLGQASFGRGFFGSVSVAGVTLQSTMVCKGSINGTATVTGEYTWCPQATDHNPNTNPHDPDGNPSTPDPDPTDWNCNGAGAHSTADESVYPGEVPANVHVVASATLTPGLVWNDAAGNPAPGPCDVTLEGHAIAPTRLDASINCAGHTYEGSVEATFVPIVGPVADFFSHPSDPSQNPERCATWEGGNQPDCFRALVFQGNMSGVAV